MRIGKDANEPVAKFDSRLCSFTRPSTLIIRLISRKTPTVIEILDVRGIFFVEAGRLTLSAIS